MHLRNHSQLSEGRSKIILPSFDCLLPSFLPSLSLRNIPFLLPQRSSQTEITYTTSTATTIQDDQHSYNSAIDITFAHPTVGNLKPRFKFIFKSNMPLHHAAASPAPDDPFALVLAPPPNETPEERAAREAKEQEALRVSNAIDESLKAEKAAEKRKKIVRLLLLGQSESGV